MEAPSKGRAWLKFFFWTAAAAAVLGVVVQSLRSGQMASWYYYTSSVNGYAVNADTFNTASKQQPARLTIGDFSSLEGLQAARVTKGERLPRNATGVISDAILKDGKRAALQGDTIEVRVPWEIKTAKGFKFKDTFKHKGIRTFPWAAVWNVGIIFALGLCLGYMAEGFTDILGIRLHKIRHFEGH